MKAARRCFAFLLILCCPLTFSGCLSPVQLNERAIVQAVGLDWADGQIRATFQIFAPSGNGGISASADNARIITADGPTISEAVQNATLTQGKQLFVGHSRIIIIGRALAEQGLAQPLSYFSANAWSRSSIHLALAENTAEEILSAKINQGILPADTLEAITENAAENGFVQNIQLYEFLGALEDGHEAPVLPVLRQKSGPDTGNQGSGTERQSSDTGSDQSQESLAEVSGVEIAGMAVFDGDRLAALLSREESRGLLWLRDAIRHTVLVTQTPDYSTAALRIYHAESSLTPVVTTADGVPQITFHAQIRCEGSIGEALPRAGQPTGTEALDALELAAGAVIQSECSAAFERTVRELRTDPLHLGSILWKQEPSVWKPLQETWPDSSTPVVLELDVRVEIDRIGLEQH